MVNEMIWNLFIVMIKKKWIPLNVSPMFEEKIEHLKQIYMLVQCIQQLVQTYILVQCFKTR